PGGVLLFAENLTGSALLRQVRKRFVRWGNVWRYVNVDEMREFMDDFTQVELFVTGVLGALGPNERLRQLLSTIDRAVLNRLAPQRWKYIAYGKAVKPG